jgi:hypothetical protein
MTFAAATGATAGIGDLRDAVEHAGATFGIVTLVTRRGTRSRVRRGSSRRLEADERRTVVVARIDRRFQPISTG